MRIELRKSADSREITSAALRCAIGGEIEIPGRAGTRIRKIAKELHRIHGLNFIVVEGGVMRRIK